MDINCLKMILAWTAKKFRKESKIQASFLYSGYFTSSFHSGTSEKNARARHADGAESLLLLKPGFH